MSQGLLKNIRYYGSFQVMYVFTAVILTSLGTFFHFLLDHEISIIEAWIHNNHWEILILSKLFSLFILNRWFKMRLYELKSIRELVRELVKWPEPKGVVISVFMLISYLAIGKIVFNAQIQERIEGVFTPLSGDFSHALADESLHFRF